MKRFTALVFTVMMLCCLMSGTVLAENKKVRIVATIFPIYDWVREIAGDRAEITMLMDSGVDLHSFQPTAQDILTISTADLFIYVGGESDEWVEDVLKTAMNPELRSISLLEALGSDVKMEELVEGMEHEHDHGDGEHEHEDEENEQHDDHDHDGEKHDHEHEEEEADEHVWLSLRNARVLCHVIADMLSKIDPGSADIFHANLADYETRLAALDAEYAEMTGGAAYHTVLFGDRFPFRYLVDDYGLDYYAAFSGCSAESEASFETIIFLAGKVDELNLPAVLTIEGANHRIAETVAGATAAKNQRILTMNSMQSVTAQGLSEGLSYMSVMQDNLETLRQALN